MSNSTSGASAAPPPTDTDRDPRDIRPLLSAADALIIVPPFIHCAAPSLGAHIIQACAREAGFRVNVLYASLSLSAELGTARYESIGVDACIPELIGERFFAAAAHDLPPLGHRTAGLRRYCDNEDGRDPQPGISWAEIQEVVGLAPEWADAIAAQVAEQDVRVVGCTAVAQQTNASIALLNRIKRLRPDIVTIMGGANCQRDMAAGIASLSPLVDFVFSGEAEHTFPAFLRDLQSGRFPRTRIIRGRLGDELDAMPRVCFTEFFDQLAHLVPDARADEIWLPYQSSRGCWWGQKHHCTFCGNYLDDGFREKSADRVLEDLRQIRAESPSRRVLFIDHIMPHSYFQTLIPRLANELTDLRFFYEQKANMSLDRVVALRDARVTEFQPGVEALNTSLLRRMDKGVSAAQNIRLLRYARATQLLCAWNLLFGFPEDQAEEYEETLALLPLLRHLFPPRGLSQMSLDRFSPYWEHPERYGITNIRPFDAYTDVSPLGADVNHLGYHFNADYPSASRDSEDIARRLVEAVDSWRASWRSAQPVLPHLWVNRLGGDLFLLRDTRGLDGLRKHQTIGPDQVSAALVGGAGVSDDAVEWAIDCKVGVMLDGRYVPLATATPELLREFEGASNGARTRSQLRPRRTSSRRARRRVASTVTVS